MPRGASSAVYAPDEIWRAGAEIEIHLALAEALAKPVLAERDRFHLDRAGAAKSALSRSVARPRAVYRPIPRPSQGAAWRTRA